MKSCPDLLSHLTVWSLHWGFVLPLLCHFCVCLCSWWIFPVMFCLSNFERLCGGLFYFFFWLVGCFFFCLPLIFSNSIFLVSLLLKSLKNVNSLYFWSVNYVSVCPGCACQSCWVFCFVLFELFVRCMCNTLCLAVLREKDTPLLYNPVEIVLSEDNLNLF